MFSKKVSPVILFIACSLMMVACGAPPSPPAPPPEDEPGQVNQPSQVEAPEQAAPPSDEQPAAGEQEATAAPVAEQPPAAGEQAQATAGGYPIVDTGQTACYDNQNGIDCPQADAAFYGQDAQYADAQPSDTDNGDGTISDNATGLMWQQADSSTGLNWAEALAYCQDLTTANYDDWRLPNVKELQSIVDYSRSPQATGSAAIDPLFTATAITNEAGQPDYPAYWTSTTHPKWTHIGDQGVYLTFGRAMGYLDNVWQDVHGAGAQRSDPKVGNPADYPTGHGPQGDAIRIYNYARCVRSGAEFVEGAGSGADISAQPSAGGQPPAGDGPPQEAINACSGLSENVSCQFTTPRGDVSGTCMSMAGQLACVSEGGPPSP